MTTRRFFGGLLAVAFVVGIFFFAHIPLTYASITVYNGPVDVSDGRDQPAGLRQDMAANSDSPYISSPGASNKKQDLTNNNVYRICYIVDPSSYPTYANGRVYSSPENNAVNNWYDGKWHRWRARDMNGHVTEITCVTSDKPAPTLTVSPTTESLA